MKYEILDKEELDASVGFYQAYFYGNGERSLLLSHLETWPSHANWLVAEILFFLKNHDQDSRWPNVGIGYDIRDDQIWMYFTTGIDENNTYYDEYTEENYPDRVTDIANFMNIDPFLIEVIINYKMQQT
uniref:Uncharacterized protein n=1 Tax=uncultured proteobacterium eBACred25D05 TaxID=287841 RepID=Q6BA70_9PROT|nr:hypothetical protein [uncultured proteobacterium eBACred25D05]